MHSSSLQLSSAISGVFRSSLEFLCIALSSLAFFSLLLLSLEFSGVFHIVQCFTCFCQLLSTVVYLLQLSLEFCGVFVYSSVFFSILQSPPATSGVFRIFLHLLAFFNFLQQPHHVFSSHLQLSPDLSGFCLLSPVFFSIDLCSPAISGVFRDFQHLTCFLQLSSVSSSFLLLPPEFSSCLQIFSTLFSFLHPVLFFSLLFFCSHVVDVLAYVRCSPT